MNRPNVVLVLVDDMGFSDIGCYGGEIDTPNVDRLARGGVRLSQFYNTARCSPSRASLLTGLHPHQTGIGILTNDDRPRGYPGTINDRTPGSSETGTPRPTPASGAAASHRQHGQQRPVAQLVLLEEHAV